MENNFRCFGYYLHLLIYCFELIAINNKSLRDQACRVYTRPGILYIWGFKGIGSLTVRVITEWQFCAQNMSYFTQKIICVTFAHHLCMKRNNFCAIFRIVPHHTQQVLRIFAQNYLRKEQNCAKFLASKNKFSQKSNILRKN